MVQSIGYLFFLTACIPASWQIEGDVSSTDLLRLLIHLRAKAVRKWNMVIRSTGFQVYILREVHLGRNCLENESLLSSVWMRELDLTIESTRAQKGRVESVLSVSSHDDLYVGGLIEARPFGSAARSRYAAPLYQHLSEHRNAYEAELAHTDSN